MMAWRRNLAPTRVSKSGSSGWKAAIVSVIEKALDGFVVRRFPDEDATAVGEDSWMKPQALGHLVNVLTIRMEPEAYEVERIRGNRGYRAAVVLVVICGEQRLSVD